MMTDLVHASFRLYGCLQQDDQNVVIGIRAIQGLTNGRLITSTADNFAAVMIRYLPNSHPVHVSVWLAGSQALQTLLKTPML
jgi:hypothetical protein